MGMMMILVAQLEGMDGLEQVEPTNYGIVLEVSDWEALDEWLDENPFTVHEDAREFREEILESNEHISFASDNDMVRLTREEDDS